MYLVAPDPPPPPPPPIKQILGTNLVCLRTVFNRYVELGDVSVEAPQLPEGAGALLALELLLCRSCLDIMNA